MKQTTVEFVAGMQVIRRTYLRDGFRQLGVVERVFTTRKGTTRAYVRWHSTRLRGTGDYHSTIATSSLVVVTEAVLQELAVNEAKAREEYQARQEQLRLQAQQAFLKLVPGQKHHVPCRSLPREPWYYSECTAMNGEVGTFRCGYCGEEHTLSVEEVR